MASLGTSLVFSLRYPAEMARLCWNPRESGEDPDLEGLENGTRVLGMATAVAEAACLEAADFLLVCAQRIEEHFGSMGSVRITKKSQRRTISKNWDYYAALERQPWIGGCWLSYGVWINARLGVVVPYLWRSGDPPWQEATLRILGSRVRSPSDTDLASDPSTVAIARIEVAPKDLSGFDVDREPLVEKVVQSFMAVSASDLEALFQIVRKDNEEPNLGE